MAGGAWLVAGGWWGVVAGVWWGRGQWAVAGVAGVLWGPV